MKLVYQQIKKKILINLKTGGTNSVKTGSKRFEQGAEIKYSENKPNR